MHACIFVCTLFLTWPKCCTMTLCLRFVQGPHNGGQCPIEFFTIIQHVFITYANLCNLRPNSTHDTTKRETNKQEFL